MLYSLAWLKFICCIGVVCIHTLLWHPLLDVCTASFMLIAFFLASDHFLNGDRKWLLRRLYRILLPLWTWSIITFLVLFAQGRSFSMHDVVLQMLFGHVVALPLYFLFDLAALSVVLFYACHCRVTRRSLVLPSTLFASVCVCLQVSGLVGQALSNVPDSIFYPVSRFFTYGPSAALGLILGSHKDFFLDRRNRKSLIAVSVGLVAVALVLRAYHIFPLSTGLWGPLLAVSSVVFWLALEPNLLWSSGFKGMLHSFQCSSGIYYIHGLALSCLCSMMSVKKGVPLLLAVFGISFLIVLCLRQWRWTRWMVR